MGSEGVTQTSLDGDFASLQRLNQSNLWSKVFLPPERSAEELHSKPEGNPTDGPGGGHNTPYASSDDAWLGPGLAIGHDNGRSTASSQLCRGPSEAFQRLLLTDSDRVMQVGSQ